MAQKESISVTDIRNYVISIVEAGEKIIHPVTGEHYNPDWFKWQKQVSNGVVSILGDNGLKLVDLKPTLNEIDLQVKQLPIDSYLIHDPGPKSIESINEKLARSEVGSIAEVFDLLRFTIIVGNRNTGEHIAQVVREKVKPSGYFLPLEDEERRLKSGRIVVEENELGNRFSLSTSELPRYLASNPNEWGINMRFKTAHKLKDVPPHMRVELRIMTGGLWKFMNNPSSPASYSSYSNRRRALK